MTFAAAELEDLRGLVSSLRLSMSELTANTDPAEQGVLEVNVQDARAGLSRGLQRLTPSIGASRVRFISSWIACKELAVLKSELINQNLCKLIRIHIYLSTTHRRHLECRRFQWRQPRMRPRSF